MTRFLSWRPALVWLVLLMTAQPLWAAEPQALPCFEANYQVFWHNVYAANAHYAVQRVGPQRYRAQSEVTPRFAFIPFEYQESSEFTHQANGILPLHFSFFLREKKEEHEGKIQFNWSTQTLQQKSTLGNSPRKLSAKTQDKISLIFQLSQQLPALVAQKNQEAWSHPVLEPKKLQLHTFRIVKFETLKTPIGKLKTVVVEQKAQGSSRHSHLWFAADLNYLLVKIQQFKDQKPVGYSLIHDYQPL